MRRLILILGIGIFIYACSSKQKVVQVNKYDEGIAVEDSVEYGLETFDAKFEAWYQRYDSPALYRSQNYYENWNRQYVNAWNEKSITSPSKFFEPIVGYNSNEDYGFELNHKLFYYFQYVENVLKIKIMDGGPRAVPI